MTKHHFHSQLGVATALLLAGACACAQQPAGTPDSDTTVVTLYSQSRTATGAQVASDAQPPVRIVDGGVKTGGDTCWKLSDAGQVITQPGDCYVLRSAAPGEKPPTQ
ncbi:hypothetical protein AB4Y45_33695 [Paraburkholderia sp. EG287A]|uniref:hypothetical protein n=1 Tax=Paraburkholderia sp. EG287A TaxID=3237012 RepID=UPI0034D19C76